MNEKMTFSKIMESKRNEYSRMVVDIQKLTLSSAAAVYKWVNGLSTPPAIKRRAIADYLGMSEEELWPELAEETRKGGEE